MAWVPSLGNPWNAAKTDYDYSTFHPQAWFSIPAKVTKVPNLDFG
jgi:hypothetical protein